MCELIHVSGHTPTSLFLNCCCFRQVCVIPMCSAAFCLCNIFEMGFHNVARVILKLSASDDPRLQLWAHFTCPTSGTTLPTTSFPGVHVVHSVSHQPREHRVRSCAGRRGSPINSAFLRFHPVSSPPVHGGGVIWTIEWENPGETQNTMIRDSKTFPYEQCYLFGGVRVESHCGLSVSLSLPRVCVCMHVPKL